MAKHEEIKNCVIFPSGEKNPYGQYVVGQSYYKGLVADPEVPVGVGNVTFEPGCRNNWHTHPSGQILIITDGVGYPSNKRATGANHSQRRCGEMSAKRRILAWCQRAHRVAATFHYSKHRKRNCKLAADSY